MKPDSAGHRRPLVLFAMRQECRPFLRACRRRHARVDRRGRRAVVRRGDIAFDVEWTGPGDANVREALRGREEELPSRIIHAGLAGAVDPGLGAGDIRRVVRVQQADKAFMIDREPSNPVFREFPTARIVSVPRPIGADDKAIVARHGIADMVDMETFAVVDWCRGADVPYTGIRIVSDALTDDIPWPVRVGFDGRRFRTRFIVDRSLRHPRALTALIALAWRCRALTRRLGATLADAILAPAR